MAHGSGFHSQVFALSLDHGREASSSLWVHEPKGIKAGEAPSLLPSIDSTCSLQPEVVLQGTGFGQDDHGLSLPCSTKARCPSSLGGRGQQAEKRLHGQQLCQPRDQGISLGSPLAHCHSTTWHSIVFPHHADTPQPSSGTVDSEDSALPPCPPQAHREQAGHGCCLEHRQQGTSQQDRSHCITWDNFPLIARLPGRTVAPCHHKAKPDPKRDETCCIKPTAASPKLIGKVLNPEYYSLL